MLNRNFDLLGIDPGRIHGLILSHGHRDHYGGLAGFVAHHRTRMRDDLGLYVGAEDVFREKWIKGAGDQMASWGALDRTALTAQNVAPVCCGHAHALDGAFTTGYIARNSFERGSGGTMAGEGHLRLLQPLGNAIAAIDHIGHAVDEEDVGRIGAPGGDARPAFAAEDDPARSLGLACGERGRGVKRPCGAGRTQQRELQQVTAVHLTAASFQGLD